MQLEAAAAATKMATRTECCFVGGIGNGVDNYNFALPTSLSLSISLPVRSISFALKLFEGRYFSTLNVAIVVVAVISRAFDGGRAKTNQRHTTTTRENFINKPIHLVFIDQMIPRHLVSVRCCYFYLR